MESVGIEKTAEWCFNAAQKLITNKYGVRCWVEKVEVFEHENNSAIFSREELTTARKIENKELVLLNETPQPQINTPEPVATPQPQSVAVGNHRV